jgi:hypothetical protein
MPRLGVCGLMLFALSALIGCSETPISASSQNSRPAPPGTALSLQATDWNTISVPRAFRFTNGAGGHLLFDFPTNGSINYLYNVKPPKEINGSIAVSVQITTNGFVIFNYLTEPFNTCTTPASVRPFIWANQNSSAEFDRWWSNPTTLTLAAGAATLAVKINPDQWTSMNGKRGNADAASLSGFNGAIRNVSSLGLTFGGGCFFGHGVYVEGGTAQFRLDSYRIERSQK